MHRPARPSVTRCWPGTLEPTEFAALPSALRRRADHQPGRSHTTARQPRGVTVLQARWSDCTGERPGVAIGAGSRSELTIGRHRHDMPELASALRRRAPIREVIQLNTLVL
jgi:hypothetical protein